MEATADNHVVQGSAVRMILAVMAFALAILSVHPEGNLVIAIIHVVEVSHVKTIQAFVSEMMKKTWQPVFAPIKETNAEAPVASPVAQASPVRIILAVLVFVLAMQFVHPEVNLVIPSTHVVEVSLVKTIQVFVLEMMKKTWQFTKLKISFAQASVKLVQALMKMECSVVLDLNARITSMVMEFVLRCIPPATLCAVELDKHAVEQLKMLSSVAQDMNVKTISMDMAFA